MINKVRAWEAQILRLTFRPRMRLDETWVANKNKNVAVLTEQLEEDGSTAADRKNRERNVDYYDVGRLCW